MATIQLVILGTLSRRPMHGYEIKHIIEDHMGDWTDIKFGSIYFALSTLSDKKSVEVIERSQDGNRPSRIVYQITERGRQEYLRMLRELWMEDDHTLYSFDIGVFFMHSLPKPEVRKLLDQRIVKMESKIKFLKQHQEEQGNDPHIPALASAIMLHSQLHFSAELTWMKDLKEKLDEYY